MTTKALKQQVRDAAREDLRELFAKQKDPTVYTVLRHVSASGMSRDISLLVVDGERLRNITYLAAQAMGGKVREVRGHWAIRVGGCGMDMGFHLVYGLSSAVYGHENDGGYTLSHEWA